MNAILLDYRVCHLNVFSTGVLLSKWIQSFQHPQDPISVFHQRCLFHPSPSCLCFSRTPTLFLQGIRYLNQASFYSCEVSPFLFRQCSYPVILMKILTELQVRHSSLVFFSGGTNSSFLCWSYSFPCFKCLLIPVHLIHHPFLAISIVPECSRYLKRLV